VLFIDDLVEVLARSIEWSLLKKFLDTNTGCCPVPLNVLFVSFGELDLKLRINVFSKLDKVWIIGENFPGVPMVQTVKELISLFIPYDFFVSKVLAYDWVFLRIQIFCLDVDCEQSHGLDAALNSHCVDFSANALHLIRHDIVKMA
jgi:hypothetical protein